MKIALFLLALPGIAAADLSVSDDGKALTVKRTGGNPVLSYQYADYPPPAGVDEAYTRSGFIYPLLTPKGTVVTGIHPGDHYHHLGVWHPWTKTTIEGQEVDFWNLIKKEGTMRHAGISRKFDGEKAGFVVEQQHVQLNHKEGERVVIEEELSVTVTEVDSANIVDYEWKQVPVIDSPVKLPAYRYGGGIAFRARSDWDGEVAQFLTSEGKTRKNGHATRARWCLISGPGEKSEKAAVVLMNHPSNHDHPQRMRIHPAPRPFFNFVPQQEHDWQLEPGKVHTMRYRILTFDKVPGKDEIEAFWKDYASTK